MAKIKFGWHHEIHKIEPETPCDVFENAIRDYGVVTACEWFGHVYDSEFTKKTIDVLLERSNARS